MVLEVTVHFYFAPLVWTCGKAEHHDKEDVGGRATHLIVGRNQRESIHLQGRFSLETH
jgi:hypothetical protein